MAFSSGRLTRSGALARLRLHDRHLPHLESRHVGRYTVDGTTPLPRSALSQSQDLGVIVVSAAQAVRTRWADVDVGAPLPTDFDHQVRDALNHLYDHVYLQTHSLARLIAREQPAKPANAGKLLRNCLLETIESLRPSPSVAAGSDTWRRYQIMALRYVEGLESVAVQSKLAISQATYYREHAPGLAAIVSLLRERWGIVDGDGATSAAVLALPAPSIPPDDTEAQRGQHIASVCFLFTDVEGSTKLWEQRTEAMRRSLIRHEALIGQGVARHGGTVVRRRGEGDSFFIVFSNVINAVEAACTIQSALMAEPWPEATPISVRMALHTGEADFRDGDYYGPDVNRCARLRAVARGGQTLLSGAVADVVRDALPEGASLHYMGEQRLRDITKPERVYQILHPNFVPASAPFTPAPHIRHNLPLQLTSFIGRDWEVRELTRLLSGPRGQAPDPGTSPRLLTLVGSPGIGKTRLGIHAAADLLDNYPDGVWLVELAGIVKSALVPQAVVTAMGLHGVPDQPAMETAIHAIRDKQILLVLDNCEHLIEACAHLAETLLRACPELRILSTSREALGISGELVWKVPPLPAPDPKHCPPLERCMQYEAMRLFVDRATAVLHSFSVHEENVRAVAEICHRLDGIALAIELAAVRVKVLSVEQIAARLSDRFRLLTQGTRTHPARQQTLRALIDWSYDLLPAQERVFLRRLSVFAGGFTLEAAERVTPGESVEPDDVLDLLAQMVDKSLVVVEPLPSPVPDPQAPDVRCRILEMIREYGREKLEEAGETALFRDRHRAWTVEFAAQAEAALTGPEQRSWLDQLELEHDNLRAALEWSVVGASDLEPGLRLGSALWRFWSRRGHVREGRQRLEAMLVAVPSDWGERASPTHQSSQAKALNAVGFLAMMLSDFAVAKQYFDEAFALGTATGDESIVAFSLAQLASLDARRGNLSSAKTQFTESLRLWRKLIDRPGMADALFNLGTQALYNQGDFNAAGAAFAEGLDLAQQQGDKWSEALLLQRLFDVSAIQGRGLDARKLLEESLAIWRQLGDERAAAIPLHDLGVLELDQGDVEAARKLLQASLETLQASGDTRATINPFYSLGLAALDKGELATARAHFSRSRELIQELGERGAMANWIYGLGLVALAEGDVAAARASYVEYLDAVRQSSDRRGIAYALDAFAGLASAQGQPRRALRLAGSASALRDEIGVSLMPHWQRRLEPRLRQARLVLQDAAEAAWAEGRVLSVEAALAEALAGIPATAPSIHQQRVSVTAQ